MREILTKVSKYCKQNNKTLAVALSSVRNDKKKHNYLNREIDFFKSTK